MRKYKGMIGRLAAVGVYVYLNRVEILQLVRDLGIDKYFKRSKSKENDSHSEYVETLLNRIKNLEEQLDLSSKEYSGQANNVSRDDIKPLNSLEQFRAERREWYRKNPSLISKEEYELLFGKKS